MSTLIAPLAGCSFGSDVDKYVPTEGPLAVYPSPSGGLEDEREGTLALAGGCLVLVDAAGAAILPVFPSGAAVWDGTVLTYEDATYEIGDHLQVVGGVVSETQLGPMTYIPADCDRSESFFVAP